MKNKLPFKKETSQEKKFVSQMDKTLQKKPRSWVDSEPKNWSSKVRGWYKCRPHLIIEGE